MTDNYKHSGKCCGTCKFWEGSYWSNNKLQFGSCQWQKSNIPKPYWRTYYTSVNSEKGKDCKFWQALEGG